MSDELKEFLNVLRRAMRVIKSTGDTRRGLLMVRAYLNNRTL